MTQSQLESDWLAADRSPALPHGSADASPGVANGASTTALTEIRPVTGWQSLGLPELWRYRSLIYFLIWRDVKVRYKQTFLGAAWAVLQPAMMMIVFTILFGRMVKVDTGGVPYPLFAYLGLLPWTFFATALASAGNSVVGSERLVTKIYFPRLAIPLSAVGAAAVDFAIAAGLLVVLMIWYGFAPAFTIFLAPVVFIIIAMTAVGIGALLSALTVAYRDFRYVIPFLVQLWLFATPSVYLAVGPAESWLARILLYGNPLTGLIAAFRAAVLTGGIAWAQLLVSLVVSVLILLAGCLYFRRVEASFADAI